MNKETDRASKIELLATVIMSIATILAAWSAFEAGKWGGTQSIRYAEAGASRVESTRLDTAAGQQTVVDIGLFTAWAEAVAGDIEDGSTSADLTIYEPDASTLSGFFYSRFRSEFIPAMEAWMASDPLGDPSAAKTPFVVENEGGERVYVLEKAVEADQLAQSASDKSALALEANQTGDNYVLTMVLFASVLFFAGISSKLTRESNRSLAVGVGSALLLVGGVILISLPILI